MLEPPHYRPKVSKERNQEAVFETKHPKLFFTSNGPKPELAGQEEPFPKPDNQSKMKRSCENAEHVGMYPGGGKSPAMRVLT